MKHIPLKQFFEERLKEAPSIPKSEMGVKDAKGRIGGYITGNYRKVTTFAEIKERRERVNKLLAHYSKS